jgi:hypothetical protein
MTFGRKEMVIQKMLKEQEGIQMKNTQISNKKISYQNHKIDFDCICRDRWTDIYNLFGQ